jgi:ribose 5-phosphate isomerase A
MTVENAKKAAGCAAAHLIENGMIVGLGTGSTARYFIEALARRTESDGLVIESVVASSKKSYDLAKGLHLPVADINDVSHVDITVDGADEIDPLKRMIKGGGGAHVREKILAYNSKEMIVIIETKKVPSIGVGKLPVEVLFFGSPATRHSIEALGYTGQWRLGEDRQLFITDNGNVIFDIFFPFPPPDPRQDHEAICHIPGVIDTGFFFDVVGRVITGFFDGHFIIESTLRRMSF